MSENNNEIESKEIETEIQQDSDQLHEKTQSEDSVKDEKLIKDEKKETKSNFFKDWIVPIVAAIGIAFIINKFLVYNVYIPSESMVPTLNIGDKLMVTRIYNTDNIERGDIIVFYSDELSEVVIKRAIGLPGDKIVIHDGIVNVNGEDLKEDYVKNNEILNATFNVPEGKFFFLGDNRNHSFDSRYWEDRFVNKEDIVYHLGNFGIGTLEELKSLYDKLNGIKYLILGEEDMRYDKDFFDEIGFKEVYEHEIVIGKYVLTYYPKDVLNGMINIYGKDNCEDIVSNFKNKNYVCVSAENINSRPILLKEEE